MQKILIISDVIWFVFFLLGIGILGAILFAIRTSLYKLWSGEGRGRLARAKENPILKPELGRGWDDMAVFNPAALDLNGTVHLLFRAIGGEGVSRLGYATTSDGVHIDERLPYPVFVPLNPREPRMWRGTADSEKHLRYDTKLYASGGSWGGSEDPRMTKIGETIYVTFNMFDGWDFIRVALTTIRENDFLEKRWRFSTPIFLSTAGEVHKNWVLFPEKMDGKFAILHSLSPEVQIDFVNRLEDLAEGKQKIKSRYGQNGPRKGWDTWIRSAGPPPIKTDRGWLVIYHAIQEKDSSRYKVGALLLDLKDPRRVIARSREPILTPDFWYENEWKPGIVYACGAIVRNGTLFVYYGGGDQWTNVATINLNRLLSDMKPEGAP